MKDQIIITMGREHGSGGHYIADMIARELGIKLYDKDSIESEIVSEGYSEELIRRMDEKPVNFFASRRIGRFSNSLEVNVAEKTFDMIRAKAASGESFLLIGRCGEQVLKDDPHRVSLFIGGDPHAKLCRVMEKKGLSAEEAIEEIRTVDHQRKAYHNYYCEMKWGDARAYDLTVKSDVLGMEGTNKRKRKPRQCRGFLCSIPMCAYSSRMPASAQVLRVSSSQRLTCTSPMWAVPIISIQRRL